MTLKQLGRYELHRVLGKGAMGLVYQGRDPNLDRQVAIKTISMDQLSEEAAADYELRFRNEARSAGRLQHANIVSVYDAGRDGDTAFLVMELVEGKDLKHYLDNGERYPLAQTLAIMEDLLAALGCAHSQNVVHRDVKPANMLVERGGRIKLTDFGVARIQDAADVTRTQGTMVGTLKYMSPEQVKGLAIDTRADIFAAGVVLYQLLTGHRPFSGATDFAIIQNIVGREHVPPTSSHPGLPAALDAVVAKALAKSRDGRFQTAAEFSSALLAACQDAIDLSAPPQPGAEPAEGVWSHTLPDGEWPAGLDTNTNTNTNVRSADNVAQELELVYWKDVRGTHEPRDLQLFIEKFPAGIYVDLAMRRLAALRARGAKTSERTRPGVATAGHDVAPSAGAEVSNATPAPADQADPALTPAMGQADPVPFADALAAAAAQSVAGVAHAPVASPPGRADARAQGFNIRRRSASHGARRDAPRDAGKTPTYAAAGTAPGRKHAFGFSGISGFSGFSAWLASRQRVSLAGALALALGIATTVFGVQRLLRPAVPDAGITSSASQPAVPDGLAATAEGLAVTDAATSAVALAGMNARPAGPDGPVAGASRPAPPASSPSAARVAMAPPVARPALRSASGKSPSGSASAAETPASLHSSEAVALAAPAAPAVAAPLPPTNPRAACEGRVLLGFQMCMTSQCAKPAFAGHSVCQERLVMEERRREIEQFQR